MRLTLQVAQYRGRILCQVAFGAGSLKAGRGRLGREGRVSRRFHRVHGHGAGEGRRRLRRADGVGGGVGDVEEARVWDLTGVLLAPELELRLHTGELVLVALDLGLGLVLLGLEHLVLLALALTRVVGGEAVALHAFYPALLLLVLRLGSLARGQAGLGLGEHLPPRLALLRRLPALGGGRRGRRRSL